MYYKLHHRRPSNLNPSAGHGIATYGVQVQLCRLRLRCGTVESVLRERWRWKCAPEHHVRDEVGVAVEALLGNPVVTHVIPGGGGVSLQEQIIISKIFTPIKSH